jgi:hypothetical protein
LWYCGVIEVQEEPRTAIFWFIMHHALGDGNSVGMIQQDLMQIINGEPLSNNAGDYEQTVLREEEYLKSTEGEEDKKFWMQKLSSLPPTTFDDFNRAITRKEARQISVSGCHRFRGSLDAVTTGLLQNLAKRNAVSFHTLIVCAVALETTYRTRRTHFLLGTPVNVRTREESDTVGYHVNEVCIVIRCDAGKTYQQLIRETHSSLSEALAHSKYPFNLVYEELWALHPELRQEAERHPLFDISVTENPVQAEVKLKGTDKQPNYRLVNPRSTISYERTPWPHTEDAICMHQSDGHGGTILEVHMNDPLWSKDQAEQRYISVLSRLRWLATADERTVISM